MGFMVRAVPAVDLQEHIDGHVPDARVLERTPEVLRLELA